MATKSASPTTDQTAENLQEILERITEHAAEAEARIRESAKKAQKDLTASAKTTQQNAKALSADIEEYVHEHPLQALGIAFMGGLVLSSLLKRN